MAHSFTQTIELALVPQQAEAAVYQALVATGVTGVRGGGGMLEGGTSVGWSSWGEKVTAVVGFGPRGSVVTLTSTCSMPTQIVDFGKNKKNVTTVVEALRGAGVPVL